MVGTVRRELPDRILIINQRHAATALDEFEHHYKTSIGRTGSSARPLPYDHCPSAPEPRSTESGVVTASADCSTSIGRPHEVRRVSGSHSLGISDIVAEDQLVWVPETVHTALDLLLRCRPVTGMIRRWSYS